MASTRKSSRVRVPKIREDAAAPAKRSKANTSSAAAAAPLQTPPPPASTTSTVTSIPITQAYSQSTGVLPSLAAVSATTNVLAASLTVEGESGVPVEEIDPTNSLTDTGTADGTGEEIGLEKIATAIFKNPNFVHSTIGAAGTKRTRVWKNLKQIISTERSLPWKSTDVSYGTVEGPPSFKPSKKYSDLSGLEAPYTDPQTKLRFANPDEFNRARTLPSDLVTGYLALRKATAPVP